MRVHWAYMQYRPLHNILHSRYRLCNRVLLLRHFLLGSQGEWCDLFTAERMQQRSLHQQRRDERLLLQYLHGGGVWQQGVVCGGRRVMSDACGRDVRDGYL